jgi:amino acid permease
MDKKIKYVNPNGKVNHIQMLIICLFSFPVLIVLLVLFGETIDHLFQFWQYQFIFFMVVLLIVGGTWFGKKLRG